MGYRRIWSPVCARVKLTLIISCMFAVADRPSASEYSSVDLPERIDSIRLSMTRPTDETVVLTGHRSVVDLSLKVSVELHTSWFCLGITSSDPEVVTAGLVDRNITQDHQCFKTRHELGLRTPRDQNAPDPHYDLFVKVSLVGVQAGFASLNMRIQSLPNFTTQLPWTQHQQLVMQKYGVVVVNRVSIFQDAFFFIISSVEMLTLTLICLQLRPDSLLEVLRRPHALLTSALMQALVLPMITVGSCVAINLQSVHSLIGLLVIGCSPTGFISPMIVVILQGHIDLTIVLLLQQYTLALGIVPAWLYIYCHVTGLDFSLGSIPFWYLGGALCTVFCTLAISIFVQRYSRVTLTHLDKVIHPTCLLLTLTAGIVSSCRLSDVRRTVTWTDVLGSSLIVWVSCLIAVVALLPLTGNISQTKTLLAVSGVKNVALASIQLEGYFSQPDASLMSVSLTCFEFVSLTTMYVLCLVHIVLSARLPQYRKSMTGGVIHITEFYRSIAEQMFRSMVKAGEITFRRQTHSCDTRAIALSSPTVTSSPCPSEVPSTSSLGFCKPGIAGSSSRVLVVSSDSIRFAHGQNIAHACPPDEQLAILSRRSVSPQPFSFALFASGSVTNRQLRRTLAPLPEASASSAAAAASVDDAHSLSIDYEMLSGVGAAGERTGVERKALRREDERSPSTKDPDHYHRHQQQEEEEWQATKTHLTIFDNLFSPLSTEPFNSAADETSSL